MENKLIEQVPGASQVEGMIGVSLETVAANQNTGLVVGKAVPLSGPSPQPPTALRPPATNLAAKVNQAQGQTTKIPKGLTLFNTRDLDEGYFHFVLYSETSARKSSTAAVFETPEYMRIILTRRREQMIPLRDAGYQVALVEDAAALDYALRYPERLWPDWAAMPDPEKRRTLLLDDGTEAVNMLLEDSEFNNGKEVKDIRRRYGIAGDALRSLIKLILNKPYNFGMITLAAVKETPLTAEESIMPQIPPSMLNMILTEFEYVLYIDTKKWKLLTDRDSFAYTGPDPDNPNKEKTFRRSIFAKFKMPLSLVGKGVVKQYEDMDLRALWARLKSARNPAAKPVAPVKK